MPYQGTKPWSIEVGGKTVHFATRYRALRGAFIYAKFFPGVEVTVKHEGRVFTRAREGR